MMHRLKTILIVLEDYLQMLKQMIEHTPDIFFESPAFILVFQPLMAALTLVQTDVVWAALELLSQIFNHNCLEPSPNPPPKFPIFAAAISEGIEKNGFELIGYILAGLVGEFPEESLPTVVTSIRTLAALWPAQLLAWLPVALQGLPPASAPMQARSQFVAEMTM
jgi:transportin-3